MARLASLDWRLASTPWTSVFSAEGKKMIPGKENATLLGDQLHSHLAPRSMQVIKKARKRFEGLRGVPYPVSEEKLGQRLPMVEVPAEPESVEHRPE